MIPRSSAPATALVAALLALAHVTPAGAQVAPSPGAQEAPPTGAQETPPAGPQEAPSPGAQEVPQGTSAEARQPVCDPAAAHISDCTLPGWPQEGPALLPSLFGPHDPATGAWLTDPVGDAPPEGLDVLAVGVVRLEVTDPEAVRASADLLRRGGRRRAVPEGTAILVRVVLAGPPEDLEAEHVGIFVGTDVDGLRTNNAPVGVAAPDMPFADLQELYSAHADAGAVELRLLHTDLSQRRWYRGGRAFAAARPAPEVLDFLIAPQAMGQSLRVVTFAEGESGGYDLVGVGATNAPLPLDGRVGLLPRCVEGAISNAPFTVAQLLEGGETFRDIETLRSWHAGATFGLTDLERGALESIASGGADDEDGLKVAASAVLIDEGLNVRQWPSLEVRLDGSEAYLAMRLGLTRRGYHALRDVEPEPTGLAEADAFLERASRAFVAAMPPFRTTRREGALLGGGAGSCSAATP